MEKLKRFPAIVQYKTGDAQDSTYTWKDFDIAWSTTAGSTEETKIHEDILKYFRDTPESLVGNPKFKGCRADDIRIRISYVLACYSRVGNLN